MRAAGPMAAFACGLVVAGGVVGLPEAPPDRADFQYIHGFEASGEFEGTCEVAGFRFHTDAPRVLTVEPEQAELVVYRSWRNSTVVPAIGHEFLVEHEQVVTSVPIPEGPLRFEWGPGAHLFLTQRHLAEERSMHAALNGTQWITSPPRNSLSAGPGYYYEEVDGLIFQRDSLIPGPARWVTTDQEQVRVVGDGFFRFDALTLTGKGFAFEMPPYRQSERVLETPVSHLWSVLHTDAVLKVRGLELDLLRDEGLLACGGLEWSGSGAVTYRRATGEVRHGGGFHVFENRQFTVNGVFASREAPERVEVPWGQEVRVPAQSEGTFTSGADYQPLGGVTDAGIGLPAQLTIAALLGGFLYMAWKLVPAGLVLFTRVKRSDALKHPVRALLQEAALQRPGATLAEIVEETGQSYSTIRHHARILVHLEFIATVRFGREVHLFPPRTARGQARRLVSLRRKPVRFLVERVRGGQRSMRDLRAEMQASFGRGPSWATRVVSEAERSGLIVRERTDAGVMLCAAE